MNTSKKLHVISFDVPWPANYGGVIDVYYKLEALYKSGIQIILHCYEYGRAQSPELEKICSKVYYYKRNIYKNPFTGTLPYIIATRNNSDLLHNLLSDSSPILFEGLHTCFFLDHPQLKDRLTFVRTHNIEHEYYSNLEKVAGNYIKRLFFKKESERLEQYESQLAAAKYIFAISEKDAKHFKAININTICLPAFHQNHEISNNLLSNAGDFVLYHGNLGVGENDEAAKYIVKEIWGDTFHLPLIIAGNNASSELRNLCKKNKNISLVSPTNTHYINQLISTARVNLLITFQATGIKLKLIHALFQGRHCLVNKEMVEETGLAPTCHVADLSKMQPALLQCFDQPFTDTDLAERKRILSANFDNMTNAAIITQLI